MCLSLSPHVGEGGRYCFPLFSAFDSCQLYSITYFVVVPLYYRFFFTPPKLSLRPGLIHQRLYNFNSPHYHPNIDAPYLNTMSDRDPFFDILRRVEPFPFASVVWLDWPDTVYDPESTKNPMLIFKRGIVYILQCLELPAVKEEVGEEFTNFIATWEPRLSEAEFEAIIEGDKLMLATFHSGAKHTIEKLWRDVTDELQEAGLAKALVALEVALHQEFAKRMVCIPEMERVLARKAMINKIARALEARNDDDSEDENRLFLLQDEDSDEAETVVEEEAENEGEAPGSKSGRKRNRPKSKKAKKAWKREKDVTSRNGKDMTSKRDKAGKFGYLAAPRLQ